MKKLRKALAAGGDPVELRAQYNAAVGENRAAETALAAAPSERRLSREELEGYVDQLGIIANPRPSRSEVLGDPLADRVDKSVSEAAMQLNRTPRVRR